MKLIVVPDAARRRRDELDLAERRAALRQFIKEQPILPLLIRKSEVGGFETEGISRDSSSALMVPVLSSQQPR